jgi:serine/threonine-protein kinase
MAELMYKIANEPAPDIRIIRPELSEKLANIVALSVSKRSEMRYQDGDQFAADLRAVMADFGGASAVATKPGSSPTTPSPAVTATNPVFESTVVQAVAAAEPANYQTTQIVSADVDRFEKTSVTVVTDGAAASGQPDANIKL